MRNYSEMSPVDWSLRNDLSFSFFGLFGGDDPASKLQYAKSDLDEANNRLSGKADAIRSYRERAGAYDSSPDPETRSRSKAVVAEANGLASEDQNLIFRGQGIRQDLNALLNSPPPSSDGEGIFGTRVQDIQAQYAQKASLIRSLAGDFLRSVKAHVQAVDALSSDVQKLDDFAQKKGVSGFLRTAESGFSSTAGKAVTILAIGAAAYLFLPGILMRARK